MTPEQMELELRIHKDDMHAIAATDAGKRFFARFFRETRCLDGIYAKSADVYGATAKQAVGIGIWRDLHAANPAASMEIFNNLMTPVQENHYHE